MNGVESGHDQSRIRTLYELNINLINMNEDVNGVEYRQEQN